MILGQRIFQSIGKDTFLDFPSNAPLVREDHILHDLLGDRGRTAHPASTAQRVNIAHHRLRDADRINASVIVEVFVFGADERVLNQVGYIRDLDDRALLFSKTSHNISVIIHNNGCLWRRVIFQIGEFSRQFAAVPPDRTARDNRTDDD